MFENKDFKTILNSVAQGWNTWDTRSVLNHVLLPEGFSLNLGFCLYGKIQIVKEAFFGVTPTGPVQGTTFFADKSDCEENRIEVSPGIHSFDGSYTSLKLNIRGIKFRVESAKTDEGLVLLITPDGREIKAPVLFAEGKLLWNRPGKLGIDEGSITCEFPDGKSLIVYSTREQTVDPNLPATYPYMAFEMDSAVGLSTDKKRNLSEIQKLISEACDMELRTHEKYHELAEVHKAMHTSLAWNIIYEPKYERVLCTVARKWNCRRLGYGLFCWDSFFTARLLSIDNKNLAYLQALESFREMIDGHFVPNGVNGSGRRTWDRSQPPVGSTSIWAIYSRWKEKWFIEAAWEPLLNWNRWWDKHRKNHLGLLSWGSNPFDPKIGDPAEYIQPNNEIGATLESGMDNSHVYDNVPFNKETHLMELSDVGLNSLYIRDCQDLSKIAIELGFLEEARELQSRIAQYAKQLETLWDENTGIYLNKRIDTGAFSLRLSPANFYPLLTGLPTEEQAKRMIRDHLCNREEFWGEWVIPSTPRSDTAFADHLYWRGRIWPPLNFLVYLGMRNYNFETERIQLVEKSGSLLLNEWETNSRVWENYCPDTAKGGNTPNSNPLYTWGALLGLICFIEKNEEEY